MLLKNNSRKPSWAFHARRLLELWECWESAKNTFLVFIFSKMSAYSSSTQNNVDDRNCDSYIHDLRSEIRKYGNKRPEIPKYGK